MKKVLFSTFFIFLISTFSLASPGHDDRCRNLSQYAGLCQAKQVEIDLVSGTWQFIHEDTIRMIEFEENGMASLVEEHEGEIAYTDYLWTLKSFNHSVILYLTSPANDSQKYVITQNCAGVELTPLDGSAIQQWIYEEPLHGYAKLSIEEQLIGHWRSVADEAGDDLTVYTFGENGTMHMEDDGAASIGVWEITEDGDFILISLQDEEGKFSDHMALRIYDIGYHSASFTDHDQGIQDDIQYFEKR